MNIMNVMEQTYETLLCEYAAGTLDASRALVVTTHITLCEKTKNKVAEYEIIGGALLEECDSAELSATCLQNVLARLDVPDTVFKPTSLKDMQHDLGFELPKPLQNYVMQGDDIPLQWKKSLSGMMSCDLMIDGSQNKARLIKMEPGMSVPSHGHGGQELTLVIEGAMTDEHGAYQAGDLIILDEGVEHTPTADPQLGCICLAVSCAPIKLKGWASVLNPFLGK